MDIIHCPFSYFPSISGAEFYIQNISELLATFNHQVKIFCSNALDFQAFWSPNGKFIEEGMDKINDVPIQRFNVHYSPFAKLIPLLLQKELKKISDLLKVFNYTRFFKKRALLT